MPLGFWSVARQNKMWKMLPMLPFLGCQPLWRVFLTLDRLNYKITQVYRHLQACFYRTYCTSDKTLAKRENKPPTFLNVSQVMDYSKSPLRSCLEVLPADFLSVDWHQEVGCLLNKADVNMSSEENGGNIPQIGVWSMCQGSSRQENKATHMNWVTQAIKEMNKCEMSKQTS